MIKISEMITATKTSDFAPSTYHVSGKQFKSYEAASRFIKANRIACEQEYTAHLEQYNEKIRQEWRTSAIIKITKVLVKNGNALGDIWHKVSDAPDELLGCLEAIAEKTPHLTNID